MTTVRSTATQRHAVLDAEVHALSSGWAVAVTVQALHAKMAPCPPTCAVTGLLSVDPAVGENRGTGDSIIKCNTLSDLDLRAGAEKRSHISTTVRF
jgi:hypothetical protein